MANDEVRIKIKIDSNSQELVLMKQQVQDLGKSFNDTDSYAATFMKRINIAGGIFLGYELLKNTLGAVAQKGMDVNKEFQKLTNSLTMSSAVMMANNDIYGNAVSVTDKYKIAQMDAAKTTELLQKANINTPHTMKETVKIYDSMYFGMKKVGATTTDMVEITEKLSIAAGNKVPFDAFLSAMDGISTGTVEANSEMGRFLTSVGLSNEEIKNSSDVVQLFKDKLSGFQAISDFETKMSNLENSTDMFAKNLMKIPFDYIESKLPGIAKGFDSWAKSINEINVYLSNASNLSTYDELINKQYQLLGKIKEVKDDKFMWDSDQQAELKELNSELNIVFNKLEEIGKLEKKASEIGTTFDSAPIDKLVKDTLDPYGTKLDEINKKWQPLLKDLEKNGKDTSGVIEAWTKNIAELDKEFADKNKKISDASEKEANKQKKLADELSKAYSDIAQIGMSDYNKSLISITEKTQEWQKAGVSNNEILFAQSKLLDELNQKTQAALVKEDLSYYERLVQLKSDSLEKDIELASISYTQKTLDIQDMNRPAAEKEKLISLESELYSKTLERLSLDNQSKQLKETSEAYQKMLDSQISLIDATNDWNSNLTGTAASLADIASATGNLSKLNLENLKAENKLSTEYEDKKLKAHGNITELQKLDLKYAKDKAALDDKNISATLIGYSNIAGAISGMFEQGSKEAATFQIAQSTLALVEGTRAILTAGTGDPYTAIPRMIAMAAMVSSLLSNIGVAFGMNSTSTYSDSFSSMEANTGTGTVFGDASAQSESITNSLDILEDFAQPQYATLLSMNNYLEAIANNIGGVTSLLIQQGGFAFGDGYVGFDTGFKNNIGLNDITLGLMSPINSIISKIPILGQINGLFGDVVNSVLGGVFGKTKTYQDLTDSGIYFANQLLTNAINDFNGSAYQTITTTVTKKSWFSKSTSTYIDSYFQALDDETERQFSLVLGNLYNTVLEAGNALDSSEAQTANSLRNFVVSIGKISLKGKSGDQIQSTLESIFGSIGDSIAITAFPALVPFQQIGEGMFETLTRVATGMEEAEFYISRLGNRFDDVIYTAIGNKQGDVGFEALLQSIEKFEVGLYPVNNNLYKVIENLDVTAEELYSVYINLDELRDRLIFLGLEAQGLSSSMIYGAGTVTDLQSGFKSFFENFLTDSEQLTYKTEQLISQFNDLGIALPVSKDSFRDLLSSLDLTTESGQELYGRLIILSEGFAEVADATTSSIEALQTSLDELSTNSFDTFINSLESVGNSITSIKNTALSFLQGITTSNNASLEDQIITYNKLRSQFSNYFDANGNILAGVNQNDVTSLYSQISTVANNIAEKDSYLKDSLVNQFNNDLLSFNASEDILKVNIVDGLGGLIGLNSQQLSQLQIAATDGKITNDELNSISGLTKTQKDGILAFANNSSYFSTEGTLSDLATYAKLQLDAYNQQLANETVGLSRQTLTYGNYIGKQEQIDIAKLLGVSYETAQPLISNLQNLSVSKNPTSDIEKILGYSTGATSYDTNVASQLQALSPYLNFDINKIIEDISAKTKTNTLIAQAEAQKQAEAQEFAIAKENFYSRYNETLSLFEKEKKEYLTEMYPARSHWGIVEPNWEKGTSMWTYRGDISNGHYNNTTNWKESLIAYTTLQSLLAEKKIKGYAVGSPYIMYDQLAQIHEGEAIVPKTFNDGIRNGEVIMGDTSAIVNVIKDLTKITTDQANEIKKTRKEVQDQSVSLNKIVENTNQGVA